MPLKFAPLKDANCEGITPPGATELAVGTGETFLCSHVLAALGTYTNEATIEANEGGTKTSNKVVVKIPMKASFSIEKQQRLKGEANYGSGELTGKLGQTVEYKIIVKNTGNTALKFGALKDANCEGITPAGATEVAVGKEESFACTHVLAVGTYTNEASIEGNEGTGKQTSNKVTAKVVAEPSFSIEKQQRLAGEGTYGSGELTGKLGQTLEYKVIVKNTGNLKLKFGALKDTNCEGIAPSGATELAVGEEESFTCTHKLAVGTYTNEASIEGNEGTGTKTSNKVTTTVASEPTFSIEKQQRLKGEANYGTGELTGKLGQTVEYKIVVKNTGNVPLKFGALKDTGCEGISPAGATELAVGKEESFTCTHVLAVGTYTNEASIEGNEGTGTKTSNKVTAKVPSEPSYTIGKQQRLKGEANYGTSELTGTLGQTVEYKITVKNTGNVPLKFGALKDANCEGISPTGATELAVGEEESFTCTHKLAVGSYTNEASVEGNEGTGTKTSNAVTAKVPAEPNFTIEKLQRIEGEGSYVSSAKAGKLGQTVEYKIVVKNTGNLKLKFGALNDTGCEGISPAGATELEPGAEESFTCSHKLAVGTNNNEASIEGNEGTGTKTSNKVTTTVASEPTFSIEKFQRIEGEPTYTTSEITGALNQTVEYKVVVTNTGNVALKFAALKDTGCEGVTPPGATELAVGKSETFACTHKLGSVGTYTNEASIEGNEGTGTKTSNKVTAKVPSEPSYTIEKLQRIQGELTYGAGQLTGKLGQTVEYKIVVKNTGNVKLKFGALKDTGCEGISPSGATELAAEAEESFTCSHKLAVGTYTNEASIEGNEGTGTKTSNKVTAKVPSEPAFTIEKQQRIAGEGAYTYAEHTGKLGQVVEYKIIVSNTGNVKLKFAALNDTGCERISPSGATELEPGAERELHLQPQTPRRHLHQRSLHRRQRRHRHQDLQQSHRQSRLRTLLHDRKAPEDRRRRHLRHERTERQIGQTVEYKIVVKNTGNVPLKFGALKDTGCEGISPSGPPNGRRRRRELHLQPQTLGGRHLHERSLDRRQRRHRHQDLQQSHRQSPRRTELHDRKGAEDRGRRGFTKGELTGKTGQTVEYKIIVKNTGNVTLKFGALKDTGCEHQPVRRDRTGGRRRRVLHLHPQALAVGSYSNEASIEGNEGTGTKTSNKVTAKAPAEPCFTIEKEQKIEGEATYSSAEQTGKLGQKVEYQFIVRTRATWR